MKCNVTALLLILALGLGKANGETINTDSVTYKHFVGTSLWSVANAFPDPADFYELDYGIRFNTKHSLIIRAITWKYSAPLGIPFGASFGSINEKYQGYVRAFGIGAGYQRFVWKGLFLSGYATPFVQRFNDLDGKNISTGFQLFLQAYVGYRFEILKKRFYIEPAIACNYWPVNTNFPQSFLQKENNWTNYFLGEPHLNLGINF